MQPAVGQRLVCAADPSNGTWILADQTRMPSSGSPFRRHAQRAAGLGAHRECLLLLLADEELTADRVHQLLVNES